MSRPPDAPLEDLFVRYWDNALSAAEVADLGHRLTADPAALDAFRGYCLHAVAAADLPTVEPVAVEPASAQGWSRRRVMQLVGGGLAAGVGAVLLGRRGGGDAPDAGPVRLSAARGAVSVLSAAGLRLPPGGPVPAGATVTADGPNTSAVLTYPDGSSVVLTGDSAATVAGGTRLDLLRGAATADVRPNPCGADPLTLATAEVLVSGAGGAVMTLARLARATEVGVEQGAVSAAAPSGRSLGTVQGGEVLTVGPDGPPRKQPTPPPPDEFAWDLSRPLPRGWRVGTRVPTADGWVLRPQRHLDPYYGLEMYQIRSDHQWTRGLVRLLPDSLVRVRFRIAKPGAGQVIVCVRTPRSAPAASGVLGRNDAFADARPGEWHWLEARAGELFDDVHAPEFGAPWVGFLVIFNTYEVDLGLEVAEFQVSRSGGRAGP